MVVRLQVSYAAAKSAAYGQTLEAGGVAWPADEQRLPEGDPREEALTKKKKR